MVLSWKFNAQVAKSFPDNPSLAHFFNLKNQKAVQEFLIFDGLYIIVITFYTYM